MFGGSRERREKAMADYQARIRSRMDEEVGEGTVFFCGPVETLRRELKLTPKCDLVYIERVCTGAEDMDEARAYKLVRLDSWELTDKGLEMSGEFMYDHDGHLWGVRDGRSRPVRRRIRVPSPLENVDALRDVLGTTSGSSGACTPGGESGRLFVEKEVLEPVAGIGLAAVAPPIWLSSVLLMLEPKGPSKGSRSLGAGTTHGSVSPTGEVPGTHLSICATLWRTRTMTRSSCAGSVVTFLAGFL